MFSSEIESLTELEHLMERKLNLQPLLEKFTGQKLPSREEKEEIKEKAHWDAVLKEAVILYVKFCLISVSFLILDMACY